MVDRHELTVDDDPSARDVRTVDMQAEQVRVRTGNSSI
jgi:hypothetical protein